MHKWNIAGREIGPDTPPYVIAEMSANHLGDFQRALTIVRRAAACGVDAVKLQTYTADTMTLADSMHITEGPWAGQSLHDLYDEAHTPWEWHQALFEEGAKNNVTVFSSPFDESAVELLEGLGAPAYKIASFEIVDLELIKTCARTGKPMIVSTGNASEDEIAEALEAARSAGCRDLALLHCVSGYPTPPGEANLRRMGWLRERFGVSVGLSDHSPGVSVPIAATALGAQIIEKHFTLARGDGGPDAFFSLEPAEFKTLVSECRAVWQGVRQLDLKPQKSEKQNRQYRRSLYVVQDIKQGEVFDKKHLKALRPGFGLAPKYMSDILGKAARHDIAKGAPLSADMVKGFSTSVSCTKQKNM